MIKEELNKENIPFLERDIDDFQDEYDEFTKITENEYVPALMLLTLDDEDNASDIQLLAPERDFQDIYEGVNIVKGYNTQAQDSSIVELGPLPRGWTASNDMSFLSNGQGVQNITLAGPSGQIIITATKGPSADSAAKQYSGTGEVRTFEPDVTVIVEGVGNVSASDLKAVADGITVK
jgi:hypothetical protein